MHRYCAGVIPVHPNRARFRPGRARDDPAAPVDDEPVTFLPDLRRVLLAAFVSVAVSLLAVAIASASAARATPHAQFAAPRVSIDLRLARRGELTVGPGEHVRLVVEVSGGPHAGRVAAAARLFVVRLSDGARIFNGRLADAQAIELGRVPVRERYTFAVSGAPAGRVAFRADWSASTAR